MDARLLTRCTNVALVAVVGMGAGHLLMPARQGGLSIVRRVAFVALVAAAGAIAALRERSISAEYAGRATGAAGRWTAGGATIALMLAAAAWVIVHG